MRSDFITLRCPSCGGNLEIGKNVTEYKCENCGVEHLVRQSASGVTVEAFARCPVCSRNDRAEKVSSIVRSQVQETETVTYQTETTYKKVGKRVQAVEEKIAVPTKTTQATDLAKLLMPPQRPQIAPPLDPKVGSSNWANSCSVMLFLLGGGIIFLFALGVNSTISDGIEAPVVFAISMLFIALLISGVPVGLGILIRKKIAPKVKGRSDAKKLEAEEGIAALNSEIEKKLQNWETAMERYLHLYYCKRDDVVFIPGETESESVTHMNDLLFK